MNGPKAADCDGPECPSTNISGPVVATAHIALNVQPDGSASIDAREVSDDAR